MIPFRRIANFISHETRPQLETVADNENSQNFITPEVHELNGFPIVLTCVENVEYYE